MILLCPFEHHHMLKELSEMTLESVTEESLSVDSYAANCNRGIFNVLSNSELKIAAEQAYRAWLGFYNSNTKKCGNWDKVTLVEKANFFSTTLGLREVPFLEKSTVGKMGLRGVQGLRIK